LFKDIKKTVEGGSTMAAMIELKQITKTFGQQTALDGVDLSIKKGEIYGLVGVNGSGKSTLMNILFGNAVIADTGGYEGEIYIAGQPAEIRNTRDAISHGIGMIHQEFALIPELQIYENITLNREKTRYWNEPSRLHQIALRDDQQNKDQARQTLKQLGFDLDVSLPVKNLSVHTRQFVEIAREIHKAELGLLLLDEPTASLNHEDAGILMEIIKDLARGGTSILFCSHRLHEICDICDRVSVLRDGRLAATFAQPELSIEGLAGEMIGHEIATTIRAKGTISGETLLKLADFSVRTEEEAIHGINLEIRKNEILGLISLSGHGKSALCYGMMGLYPHTGAVLIDGVRKKDTIADAIAKGLFLLPDDRKEMGLMLAESVETNMAFSAFHIRGRFQKRLLKLFSVPDKKASGPFVAAQIAGLDIKCTSPKQKVGELSGGNQQKVCFARAAAVAPKLLIVMEPTRGIDIAAKEKILAMIADMNRHQGMTMLVASSEIEELKRICDRIVVLCEGRISAILAPDTDEAAFALALTGELINE
jgi:simple sugar transport system ATP-binding protein